MRTDVKIGVATGLLLVIALVAWQLISPKTSDKDPTKDGNSSVEQVAAAPGAGNGAPAERPGPRLPNFGIGPTAPPRGKSAAPVEPVIPAVREAPPAITPAPVIPAVREAPEAPAPVVPAIREAPPAITPAPVVPAIREAPPAIVAAPVIPSIREVPVPPSLPPGPVIREAPFTPGPAVVPVGPAAEETYEVQKGDSGFWAIAEKKYGDGKYYYLIAKANPNVSSNSLRPGQKLVIPAKPLVRIEPTSPAAGSPTPGGVEISPSGQKMYVVQKGDSGFWGIAQKQYGDGKYYYLLAKANPNVNSNSLQIGDKLVLPDKPAETTPAAGGTITPGTPAATPLTPGPDQKLYTITKEDTTGLWGIAKKKYGNGAYWKIIAQANPAVNASALKVGQQLIVPALTEEAKKAAGTMATQPRIPAAPAAKKTGVEDIGPTPKFR